MGVSAPYVSNVPFMNFEHLFILIYGSWGSFCIYIVSDVIIALFDRDKKKYLTFFMPGFINALDISAHYFTVK